MGSPRNPTRRGTHRISAIFSKKDSLSQSSENQPAAASIPPPPGESGIAEMLRIAGPTVATMASYTVMTFVDKYLCSKIGTEPIYVGAQGNGGLAAWVPISIAQGTLTIVNTYVSQNLGAGKPERGAPYVWNAAWIALVWWAVVLLPMAVFLPHIFAAAGMEPKQAALASEYGSVLLYGAWLTMSVRCFSQFFFGLHKPWVPMVAGIASNVVNLFLSAVLVFGNGPMPEEFGAFGRLCSWMGHATGIEPMGIKGSAVGTVIASLIELVIPLAIFLSPKFNREFKTRAAWVPNFTTIKELIKLGWPGGLMMGNEMVCWGFFMVYLVSHFGREHATAGWIAHQYMSLSFMPAVGLSVACSALVGRYMGMGRPDLAAQRAWLGVKVGMAYMGLCGVLFVIFREPLARLFLDKGTSPEEAAAVISLAGKMLIATACFQLFDATAMVLSGALRGAGDTVVPGVATVIASWVIIVLGGWLMVRFFPQLESIGPWIAAAVYIATLCLLLLARFMQGHWKLMSVVKKDAVAVH